MDHSAPAPGYTATAPHSNAIRPIHLLRAPSYNPPAFDADLPPPSIELADQSEIPGEPLMTPPPHYDTVVGTPSVDGMADYFSRLATHGYDTAVADDEEDSDSPEEEEGATTSRPRLVERHSGRVNIANPRVPWTRRTPSRSMDIQRPPELALPIRRAVGREQVS